MLPGPMPSLGLSQTHCHVPPPCPPLCSDSIVLVWTGICADPLRMHPLEQELLKAVDAQTASEGTLAFEQRTRDMRSEQSGLDAPLSATLDDLHHRVTEVRCSCANCGRGGLGLCGGRSRMRPGLPRGTNGS